ncbi:MAG TPA: hypothetical protein PKY82_23565 [Pyrinomonadaceae bacterium]|nr:hypothetical protein [Pyrinomonadaceae bacterium]
MWYEDLTQCDYFGEQYPKFLTAIGWLENGKPYSTDTIPRDVYTKLCEFSKNPWTFAVFMGHHLCDLCQFQFENDSAKGVSNIFIPHNGKIYVCPELITHYINNHFYLPPREFIEAVYVCPPQGSMEYLKKMLENGGRELVKMMKENK